MKLGFLVGYGFQGPEPFHADWLEKPSIPFDRFKRDTWEAIYGCLLRSNVDIALPVLRGKQDVGFTALQLLAEVATKSRPTFAPWVDTGALGDILTGEPFDFTNRAHQQAVWDVILKPFFDLFIGRLAYVAGESPLITWYGIHQGIIPQGMQHWNDAQALLDFINLKCMALGMDEPSHVVQARSWPDNTRAYGKHGWFAPESGGFSVERHNGVTVGVTVPGFHDHPGAGFMRVLDRRNGARLRENLSAIRNAGADLVLLEGLTDIEESAGYYPSAKWSEPDLYLKIVREFSNEIEGGTPVDAVTKEPLSDFVLFETLEKGMSTGTVALPWREIKDAAGNVIGGVPDPASDRVFSLQKDGTIQTRARNRDEIRQWESGRIVDDKLLVFVTEGVALKVFGVIRGV